MKRDLSIRMKHISRAIKWRLPEGTRFLLLVFPSDDTAWDYVTNMDPEQVVKALKEWRPEEDSR